MNKGSSVVSNNPLYVGLGLGWVQQVRGGQAKVEFRPTVFSEPPYDTHTKILDVSDLRIVKSPTQLLSEAKLDEPWKFHLLQRAAQLLVCNQDGQLGNARTGLLPHQITIAHDVVCSPRRRILIADEVGLGKTIEAGMIIYALHQRGLVGRVIIITPAGLMLQCQVVDRWLGAGQPPRGAPRASSNRESGGLTRLRAGFHGRLGGGGEGCVS